MSSFKEKRQDLEVFLDEQVQGPGAFNKRFFLLDSWNANEFVGRDLTTCQAIENVREIIAEVPAYQYSSGILFPITIDPRDDVAQQASQVDSDDEVDIDEEDGHEQDQDFQPKADDQFFYDDHTESVSSKNQNYPNTCGLSFAIDAQAHPHADVSVNISLRTYSTVTQERSRRERLGYWISEYKLEMVRLVNQYFPGLLEIHTVDNNVFVCVAIDVDINLHIYSIDYRNLQSFVSAEVIPQIDEFYPGGRFYRFETKTYDHQYQFHRIYTESLVDELNSRLIRNPHDHEQISQLIQTLEMYCQLKDIVTTLKTIYRMSSRRSRPTPIWESTPFSKTISLPPLDPQRNITRGEVCVDAAKEMFLNYQYIRYRNSQNDATIYVKLILVNRNEVKLRKNDPPQLNKKDRANQMSYFGVKLRVVETNMGVLKSYNPPHLLNIDQEQNFTKLLYRQYEDYGEGYNTSVDWGTADHGHKWVGTEFLPKQEVPKVDFRPTRILDGKLLSRIDEQALSIRNYSTLSNGNDRDLIALLTGIVTSYGEWIEERAIQLVQSHVSQTELDILERQILACRHDHRRLMRNIRLLQNDNSAMAAFRTMNTAMFMQLHHGINTKPVIKEDAPPFIPNANSHEYYQTIKADYKWRSFQLAFILLNIDGFIRPPENDQIIQDVFNTGWPERNEVADLVWFPTGGGKTEAYLGIIGFAISYRRFTKNDQSHGTAVLMRYTLRLLTLQQFQRATLLICALEVIRKEHFPLPSQRTLGPHRITIGLFVGGDSTPNRWEGNRGMREEITSINELIVKGKPVLTRLPHTECPWCGAKLFVAPGLPNIFPNPIAGDPYGRNSCLLISCNISGCAFNDPLLAEEANTIPFRLFDDDIYKFPPTLLFGTVDKFAALANKVSTLTADKNEDSRRLFGTGVNHNTLPPELIIQDELHLLLGPLGSAVGLFERGVDYLCTRIDDSGTVIRPKIITSTATTRNTDSQIFALFNRRSEIFPKQGLTCDDSFFAYFERDAEDIDRYKSNRKYVGLFPIGKTQVWMQLRVASICLAHRAKFLKKIASGSDVANDSEAYRNFKKVMDYYHTVLGYFNSLKEVGKTESQLTHYLPGDIDLITKNTMPWNFLEKALRRAELVDYSELTGRLSGEKVKTNLSRIEKSWQLFKRDGPPEFVISTNMISVGIDILRFNTMIVNSMPRNTAEYIQASSRVAREVEGIVFTVHHPMRSRDISHYQRFREFHEKFYGYVEPISVTPYAYKALERYLAMFVAVLIRHSASYGLTNNDMAGRIDEPLIQQIIDNITNEIQAVRHNGLALQTHLRTRDYGINVEIDAILGDEEFQDIIQKLQELLRHRWIERIERQEPPIDLLYRAEDSVESLFDPRNGPSMHNNWNVKQSLREIAPSVVIKTVQQ